MNNEDSVIVCEEVGIPNCKHSPQIDKLAVALVTALPNIKQAIKDAENPHLRNKYADLASVMEVAKQPLADQGIAILQPITTDGQKATVTTLLLHSSGQWMASTLSMTAQDQKPQSVGSAMTYGRRYGLSGFLGIVADDDDGNEASGTRGPRKGRDSEPEPPGVQRNTPEEQEEYAKKRVAEVKAKAQTNQKTTPPKTNVDFTVLQAFGEIKKHIGEDEYYEILDGFGYKKSNEIKSTEEARRIYKVMAARKKAIDDAKEGAALLTEQPPPAKANAALRDA